MLRSTLLYLSNRPGAARFVRKNAMAKRFARRFVAGEELREAMAAVQSLNQRGITASLDLLGESVRSEQDARDAGATYLTILDAIRERGLDANVSVKLTALGLDISEDLCVAVLGEIVRRASTYNSFVRIDMESSAYTDRTLRLFRDRLYPEFGNNVGIVLQSYLHRTRADVARAIELGCRVRLCKGAYREPPSISFASKGDVDHNYIQCMQELISRGNYPGIATHDTRIIEHAKQYVTEQSISRDRFEFQMLYGVRRDLQERLVREGYRMRVYVPFGSHWYPYLMRRLAERPANVAFMAGSVLREAISRRRP
jgi:proline dehydrogenase